MKLELFEALVETAEFKRGEKFADHFIIPWFEAKIGWIEIQRHVVKQTPELFVNTHLVCMGLDPVAQFWRKLVGMGDDRFNITVFINQLGGGLVADTRNAGKIV